MKKRQAKDVQECQAAAAEEREKNARLFAEK